MSTISMTYQQLVDYHHQLTQKLIEVETLLAKGAQPTSSRATSGSVNQEQLGPKDFIYYLKNTSVRIKINDKTCTIWVTFEQNNWIKIYQSTTLCSGCLEMQPNQLAHSCFDDDIYLDTTKLDQELLLDLAESEDLKLDEILFLLEELVYQVSRSN